MNETPSSSNIDIYQQRTTQLLVRLEELNNKKKFIAIARLASIVAAIVIAYFLYPQGWMAALGVLLLLAIFLKLVVISANTQANINNHQLLVQINEEEIAIANRQYTYRPQGSSFLSSTHEYSYDLDIFGPASLYQYINRTTSQQGAALLAHWLQGPASSIDQLLARQTAIKELLLDLPWRQQLQSYGKAQPITIDCQKKIEEWLPMPLVFLHKRIWQIVRWVYPIVSISSLMLFLADILSASWFGMLFSIYLIFSFYVSKKSEPSYSVLNKIVPEIITLQQSIAWIEQKVYGSSLFLSLTPLGSKST
jgi:hypothetical protein